jgi:hypothetical protein
MRLLRKNVLLAHVTCNYIPRNCSQFLSCVSNASSSNLILAALRGRIVAPAVLCMLGSLCRERARSQLMSFGSFGSFGSLRVVHGSSQGSCVL